MSGEADDPLDRPGFAEGLYVLDDNGTPRPARTLREWADFLEHASRVVAQDVVDNRFLVSTVFLGLDHNHARYLELPGANAEPVLWETMTFFHNGWQPGPEGVGSFEEKGQARYSSLPDAQRGHRRMVNVVARRLQEYDARMTAYRRRWGL